VPPEIIEEQLTLQEVRLLKLLSEGYSYQNAAGQMNVTLTPSATTFAAFYENTALHSKNEAVSKGSP
jgi:DNA-binding CsgD family transcriptional regulator